MSYCINPWCLGRKNSNEQYLCQSCGCNLIINERYRIIRPLRELDRKNHTEVFEIDNLGTTKILKVLTSNRSRLIQLFEQEARVLEQLKHLGVPRVDNYFTFPLQDSPRKLYCLVMEKIPGQDLSQWLAENGVLSEELAFKWLVQLIKFLEQLHQEKILHRDIKPSNIILCPDNKLVLIDFGTARKLTMTYVEKLEKTDITRVYSPGYTAPEQMKGEAVYQSDFFALGRTFVHLLTGVHPNDLPLDLQNKHLLWREKAPHISDELANVINEIIAPSPQRRLKNTKIILQRLKEKQDYKYDIKHLDGNEISGGQTQLFVKLKNLGASNLARTWSNFWKLLALSLAITISIISIRYVGMLQPFELQAFDRLMTMRPIEKQDSRFLLISIDEADIKYQYEMQMPIRWSLSDQALAQLIKKLEQYQPKTIGIDIYRDFATNTDYPYLAAKLRSDNRIFVPCKVPAPKDGAPDGISPPPEIPESRLSFSDFVADDNEVVRRQLLHLTPPITSVCIAEYAFNLQIALHYLNTQGINASITSNGELKIGKVIFKQLKNHTSGYQNIDASGYQILLNYRSLYSPLDIAQRVSLRDILEDRIAPKLIESVKDRIVIIGVTAPSAVDYWRTPYSFGASDNHKQIPGMFVQAHAIAQILSAVLDERPIIWWWNAWLEGLWIWGWSLLGGILAWCIRRPWHLSLAAAIALLFLFSICFIILNIGAWIPLIPPAVAFFAVQVGVLWLIRLNY